MTLSKKFMQVVLQKRNLKKVAIDTGVAYCSVYRLANAENIDDVVFQDKTIDAISEYLSAEFDYMKNHIIKLRENDYD